MLRHISTFMSNKSKLMKIHSKRPNDYMVYGYGRYSTMIFYLFAYVCHLKFENLVQTHTFYDWLH